MMFSSENDQSDMSALRDAKMYQLREKAFESALRSVCGTREGRLVLWHILNEICKMNHDAHGEMETVYRFMGRRSVGLSLLQTIDRVDSSITLGMMKENKMMSESERIMADDLIQKEQEE